MLLLKVTMDEKKKVLIICTGNSCRSQMAEGFLKSFGNEMEVHSAGTKPEKEVNSLAFPCGGYTKEVADIAEEVGYKYQLAEYDSDVEKIPHKCIIGRYGFYPAVSWQNQIYDMIKSL